MKKILFPFLAFALLCPVCFADCSKNCEKMPTKYESNNCAPCEIKEEGTPCQKKCDKCTIEDDEYCVYNQCFFDKQFRKMKAELCLSSKQETCIDNIYKNFKSDMETTHYKYRLAKNKLLEMIECNNDCYKDQAKIVKQIGKEAKEKCKDFNDEIKEQLCKDQNSAYRKFKRQQKRKIKKIVKYGAIYKFPCVDCCSK